MSENLQVSILAVFSVLVKLLKGEIFDPTMEVSGKTYLAGDAIFKALNLQSKESRVANFDRIQKVFSGKEIPEGLTKDKVKKLISLVKEKYTTEICYRPRFEWSGKKEGEKTRTFGYGEDWPKFQRLWEESTKDGIPDPEWVANQYGEDKYGKIMETSYALHIASEAIKHGIAISPPVKKGRGKKRSEPKLEAILESIDGLIS